MNCFQNVLKLVSKTLQPDRGASVPKFGEWDDMDPTSADGFTHIFDKVKEERHGSLGNTSGTATRTVHSDRKKHHRSKNSKVCEYFNKNFA